MFNLLSFCFIVFINTFDVIWNIPLDNFNGRVIIFGDLILFSVFIGFLLHFLFGGLASNNYEPRHAKRDYVPRHGKE